MFDVVVQIKDRTIRRVFPDSAQAVLCACEIIATDCNDLSVDSGYQVCEQLIAKLLAEEYTDGWGSPNNWIELTDYDNIPCVRITLYWSQITVRLDTLAISQCFEYRYENIGTYSNACCRNIVDDGAWKGIAYDLLRAFCISEWV